MTTLTDPTGNRNRAGWLWRPNLIVFLSNFSIMVLELVAGRIVAPYVGVSLYTWTGIIGIVLAGISLGNYLGGRLADRRASLRLLGGVFVAGGATSLLILTVDYAGSALPAHWPVVLRILVLVAGLFALPSTILGMTSPIVAKLAVQDLSRTGATVGNIYAAGTAGSIAGTFATGFILIAEFGTHAIVWGVAIVIVSLGLLFLFNGAKPVVLLVIPLAVGSTATAEWSGYLDGPCLRETNYYCIRVIADERDGAPVSKLVLDRLVHSFNALDDPTRLTYGYEEMYAELTGAITADKPEAAALFIGGGGYTFPRYMEALYPNTHLEVIEIDPGVTEIAYAEMGLSRDTRIVTHNMDARRFLWGEPERHFDLIFGDAFNDFSVPYHLTTREFNELVRDWLTPEGLYIVNLIDSGRGGFVRAFTHTLRQTFEHVYVAPTLAGWREAPHSTFVVVATANALDFEQIDAYSRPDARSFVQATLKPTELDAFLHGSPPLLLTDRYAPVEQILAPAYRNRNVEP